MVKAYTPTLTDLRDALTAVDASRDALTAIRDAFPTRFRELSAWDRGPVDAAHRKLHAGAEECLHLLHEGLTAELLTAEREAVDASRADAPTKRGRRPREANPCGRRRPADQPYEVWDGPDGWKYHVLKKHKPPTAEAADPYAKWYVRVWNGVGWSEGDTYAATVKRDAYRVS
jgi:hypothetical protein